MAIGVQYMMSVALLSLPAAQEVPVVGGAEHVLARMSDDVSLEVAECGVKVTFVVPRGKKVADAQGVIDRAATAEQVGCAKRRVRWLLSYDEAVKAGVFK